MSQLTPSDVRRWDSAAILKVFQVANARAGTLQHLGEGLGQVDAQLQGWQGEGGDAFRADLGKVRTDIEADGHQSRQVGAAVSTLWEDVEICKSMMSEIDETAQANGWTMTDGWKVDIGNTWLLMGSEEAELQRQILQSQLDTLNAKAHATDHELAVALNAAVGQTQLDYNGREIPQAPPSKATATRRRPTSCRCRQRAAIHHFPPRRRRTTTHPTSAIIWRTTPPRHRCWPH